MAFALLSGLLFGLFQALSAQAHDNRPIWACSAALLFFAARQLFPSARSAYAQNLLRGPFFALISDPQVRRLWFAVRTAVLCLPIGLTLLVFQAVLAPRDLGLWSLGAVLGLGAGMLSAMIPPLFTTGVANGADRLPFAALAPLWCRLRHKRLWLPCGLLIIGIPLATHLALSNNPEPQTGLGLFGLGSALLALLLCPVSSKLTQFMRWQPASLVRTLTQTALAPFALWLGLCFLSLLISGAPLKEGLLILLALGVATGLLILWTFLTRFSHKPATADWVLGIDLAVTALLALLALPAALLWLVVRLILLMRRVRRERWRPSLL
ncbi:hypothetical protein Astex_2906 [Asticcacaulis excentricus CB 48]|uniref:Uncharacterized protein n=2 Tax=Asticcacaulis excentricus TaxID=78587 RepID=E8RSS2_ASTEC|nr:hypothetical protein Astex_2906 [Asticcacaulis excentricus CB 48]